MVSISIIVAGIFITVIGILMKFSLFNSQTFFATLFGVLLAFILAQIAIEARSNIYFIQMVKLLDQELAANESKLKKMRREYHKGISIERMIVSNLETVVKDPIFRRHSDANLTLMASVALDRLKTVNRSADFLQRMFEGKHEGNVTNKNLKFIKEQIVYALNCVYAMRGSCFICLKKGISEKSKRKEVEQIFEKFKRIIQYEKSFYVNIQEKPSVFEIDIRTKKCDGKYVALIYEISEDLSETEKCLDVAYEDADKQKAIVGAEAYIKKEYNL